MSEVMNVGVMNVGQSKIVIKNCHQKLSSTSLIKCLKGHKSLGSLCSVVNSVIVNVSGAQPRDQPAKQGTRSPIELLWTAKNQAIWNKNAMRTTLRC